MRAPGSIGRRLISLSTSITVASIWVEAGWGMEHRYNFSNAATPVALLPVVVWLAVRVATRPATTSAQIDPRTALLETAGWERSVGRRCADRGRAFSHRARGRSETRACISAPLSRRTSNAARRRCTGVAGERSRWSRRSTEARVLLGHVQYRLGDVAAAIATLELSSLLRQATAVPGQTLERWRRELDLHDRMQQASARTSPSSFEGPAEEALATAALASLDRAYWRIGAILGAFPNHAVPVVLYTSEQFRDITRSPSWAAAAYDGTIRVPMRGALDNRRELDRVLAHEFTHALVRTLAGSSATVPLVAPFAASHACQRG